MANSMRVAGLGERFPALASRDFRIFWAGQFFSLVGSWMQATTTPYLAYRLTNQPIYLGLLGFAATLPTFFLTLPAGVLVERWNKRKTVIIMQSVLMLQAFTLAYLALTGIITIWHMVALATISGIVSSFEITARQAMLIELAGREALPNAIALNATIFNAARILGPSLAAPFLVFLKDQGEGWAFFSNGVSYLFVIVGLLIIRTRTVDSPRQDRHSMLGDFATGQRYIRGTSMVASIILFATLPGFFGFPLIQQIPVFAREMLKTGFDTIEIVATRNSLLLTFMGVGTLAGAIVLALYSTTIKWKGKLLFVGQLVFAFSIIAISFTRQAPLAMVLMIPLGWGLVTQQALSNTLIQLISPMDLRSRVISTYMWAVQGVTPFGSLFVGYLVQTFGPSTAALISGLICVAGYFCIHLINHEILRTDL